MYLFAWTIPRTAGQTSEAIEYTTTAIDVASLVATLASLVPGTLTYFVAGPGWSADGVDSLLLSIRIWT